MSDLIKQADKKYKENREFYLDYIRTEKDILEHKIKLRIIEFESKVGLEIDAIELDRVNINDKNGEKIGSDLTNANIKITL